MTDPPAAGDADSGSAARGRGRLVDVITRLPATLTVIGLLLVVGVISAGLWAPFQDSTAWIPFAYGLPALEAGRWWTPITGTFLVNQPWVYLLTISSFWGMAYLEYRRGSRVALAYFGVGQLFAILAAASLLWLGSLLPWPWAIAESMRLDVGPSCGALACAAAAVGLFASPWRVRAWAVLLSFLFAALVFWGDVADLEHLLAIMLVLVVDRSLRPRGTTVREQRLLAFVGLIVLGVIGILSLLLPTNGPFGASAAVSGSPWDVAIDVVVIVLVAEALRRGKTWAWAVAVTLAAVNLLVGALVLALIALVGLVEVETVIGGDASVTLATSVLWVILLVHLIVVRAAFRTPA